MKKVISFLQKPYSGRLGRTQFLIGFIIGFFAIVAGISFVAGFATALNVAKESWLVFGFFSIIFIIALLFLFLALYITWSLTIRRLHDIDLSGWFMLLIPILSIFLWKWIGSIALVLLLFIPSNKVINKYGEQVKSFNVFNILFNKKTANLSLGDKYLYQVFILMSILATTYIYMFKV